MCDTRKTPFADSGLAFEVVEGGLSLTPPETLAGDGIDWVPGVLEDLGKAVEGAGFGEAAREIYVTRLRVTALLSIGM
ncbi:hypothetical protein [Roseobacter sp. A03A-229]